LGSIRGSNGAGRLSKQLKLGILLAVAVLISVSTWFYSDRILKAEQVAYAAAHDIPRGNLSDLYPRWLGARELLNNRRNPYSPEITREIQQGYYGRPLDPSRPHDPKDQQGFAYPVYVIFLLAPTVNLPFDEVRVGFRWLLIVLAVVSVWLWLRLLRWKPPCLEIAIYAVLIVGWLPMVQGIRLQQLTLLVAALFGLCTACLASGWLFCAGGLLALATIKPQLAWPLVLWLLLWTVSEWRQRWRFAFGFGLAMLLLFAGAELILPGWLWMFIRGLGQYHQYTQNQSVLVWMFGTVIGRIFEAASVVGCAVVVWPIRREPATSAQFGRAVALVLALSALVVPMFAPYNQILLAPAILALISSSISSAPILPAIRVARMVGGILLAWPSGAALGLCIAYLCQHGLTPEVRHQLWYMPFYSNFMVPVFLYGLALADTWMTRGRGLRDSAAAE
jgi:hypothetical protein